MALTRNHWAEWTPSAMPKYLLQNSKYLHSAPCVLTQLSLVRKLNSLRVSNEGSYSGLRIQKPACVEEAYCSRSSPCIHSFHFSVTPVGIDLLSYLGLHGQLCLLSCHTMQAEGWYVWGTDTSTNHLLVCLLLKILTTVP